MPARPVTFFFSILRRRSIGLSAQISFREEQEPTRAFRPAQDAYPPEDAYPPQEAFPPEDAYPPADAYPPEDAYAPQDGYLPPEQAQEDPADHWDAPEDDGEEEWADDLTRWTRSLPKPHPHSIFKPATIETQLCHLRGGDCGPHSGAAGGAGGPGGGGHRGGHAKGYVETAPTLDLTVLDDQAQTSLFMTATET